MRQALATGVTFIFLLVLALLSESSYGGADSYVHYRIAKYAPLYPYLFLDQWGKPLFTICSSLFAQFGFTGIQVFNIMASLLAGSYVAKICRLRKAEHPSMGIFFACLPPMSVVLGISGLTETFFSLVLIMAGYFFLTERYRKAAIIMSFAVFARQEGILFILLMAPLFIYKKQLKELPYLGTGILVFSIIGYYVLDDFLWLIHPLPYSGKIDFYGHGKFFHYIERMPGILGLPVLIFVSIGCAGLFIRKNNNGAKADWKDIVLLMLIPALTYILIHSYLWWKGLSGSFGLTRVIGGVIPLLAVIASEGYEHVLAKLKSVMVRTGYALGVIVLMFLTPFKAEPLPIKFSPEEREIKRMADWIEENGHGKRMLFYYDPVLVFFLDKDPFNSQVVKEHVYDVNQPSKGISPGSLIVWDAHFGPNEGRLPLERLKSDTALMLIKEIFPDDPFTTMNDHPYQASAFLRK